MATVTVEVNGRPYSVGCADGQERRVLTLAKEFDETVRQVARDVGNVGDLRLFLMAALLLSDELTELRAQAARAAGPSPDRDALARAVQALALAAERVETLADEAG